MARMVDQKVTLLLWKPGSQTSAFADYLNPTVAELTGGTVKDITCFVLKSYEVRADASDTTDESAVCDDAAGQTPTRKKYIGNLPLFRSFDPADGSEEVDDLLAATFTEDYPAGWFIRRTGKDQSDPIVAGDIVWIGHFIPDVPQTNSGTGDGFVKATVPLLPTGKFRVRATVAA